MENKVQELQEKLEQIENYIDTRDDIPIEVIINIKYIINRGEENDKY